MNDTYRLNVLALGSFGRHLGRCVVKLLSSVWLLVLIDMGNTRAVLTGRTHELFIDTSIQDFWRMLGLSMEAGKIKPFGLNIPEETVEQRFYVTISTYVGDNTPLKA